MFKIQFDYRFDTNGFFTEERKSVLEAAAAIWEGLITDEFTNVPVGTELSVTNPQTGQSETLLADFEIDDLVIFVGARELGNRTLGLGGPSAIFPLGSDLENRFRGNDFEPWTGSITFDISGNWFFDSTPNTDNDIPTNSNDFFTIALHEIGHVLGFSSADAFENKVFGSFFTGSNATSLNGGNGIPLEADGHIQEGFLIGGVGPEALMDPLNLTGTRKFPTNLDLAMLVDIGYQFEENNPPVANDDSDSTLKSETVTINLLNNDTDADANDILSIESIDTSNTQGTVTNNGNGTVTYNPNGQFDNLGSGQTATDSFTYMLIDGRGGTDIATVTITINSEDNPIVDDFLLGDGQPNLIFGDQGNDTISGGEGDDTLYGGENNDSLNGDNGNDLLLGNKNDDTLNGGEGNDTLYGGQENDRLNGDNGNDLLLGNKGDDTISGSEGNDTLYGGQENDRLNGDNGNDLLLGNKGDDTIGGGEGNDTLYGGQENDRLNGDNGNDLLLGNKGDDTLTGGTNQDQFVFANQGIDVVTDFNVVDNDVFVLTSNSYAGAPIAGTLVELSLANSAVNSANNIIVDSLVNIGNLNLANTRFAFDTTNSNLLYDADGNWSNGNTIIANVALSGTLTANNFAFI